MRGCISGLPGLFITSVSGVNRTRQFNVKVTLGLACFPHCKWYIVYGCQVGFFWRTLVVPINRAFEWNDLYTVTK